MAMRSSEAKGGFSLVEVCLAVLVVGLGLLSVFALFPTGLAASEAATADTETGLFAEQVLFGIHSQAATMTWTEWQKAKPDFNFPDVIVNGAACNSEKTIAYYLVIASSSSSVGRVKQVTLYALPWRGTTPPTVATITASANVYVNKFYTELYYRELPL